MKKTRGLVIGKFFPPHEGHHYLINVAEQNSDSVDIIVCERSWERDMPGKKRAAWIKKRHPKARVHLLKYTDEEGDASSEFWAKKTVEFLGYAPDLVCTSEDYGKQYSKLLSAKHILVDKKRVKYPVSGTKVRTSPYDYWNLIDESVKAFYSVRVVVLGAESTGKTTFCQDLAAELDTVWVPEFGRAYYDAKLKSEWASDDFSFIAKMQHIFEDQMAKKSNKVLVCDTDAIATYLWEKALTGKSTINCNKFIKKFDKRIYLLTNNEIPFEQDGTRDEERRGKMSKDYENLLRELGIEYFVISGSREERVKTSKKILSLL